MLKTAALLLSLLLVSAISAFGQYREFTGKDGRTMMAKPVNVVGAQIRIEREDGMEFNVSPEIFSEEDQKFLKRWLLDFLVDQKRLFDISTKRSHGKKKKTKTDSYSREYEIYRWLSGYQIDLRNKSDITFNNIRIDYVKFVFRDASPSISGDDEHTEKVSGKIELPLLRPNATVELATHGVEMEEIEYDLKSGWYTPGKVDTRIEDKLEGIMMRIYVDDYLVASYSDPSTLAEKISWKEANR
ncbi:MAG: hypothetical protein ACQKBV_09955 [Puniceicoccales bacterium]